MDNKPMILVVEDDKPIRNFIRVALNIQGYKCIDTGSGKTAISLVSSRRPDMIIMDLGLPDIDGIEVIKQIRSITQTAIIVVSARSLEWEKVEALDSGADDYLTKPFSIGELMARIRSAFRHLYQFGPDHKETSAVFLIGDLKIDFEQRRVFLFHDEIHLTPIEYKLLALLSKNSGRVLTHRFIINEIWGFSSVNDTTTLRVFMANIRRKIEREPSQPKYILTEVSVGYRLADEYEL